MAVAPAQAVTLTKIEDSFDAFDTGVRIFLCLAKEDTHLHQKAYAAFLDIRHFCQQYEQLFSRTIPSSDVSRINSAQGTPTGVSPETADLVLASLSYCEKSGGIFDITAGCATKLWNFKKGVTPTKPQLEEAISHINWKNVRVFQQDDAWFVQLLDPHAAIDLGGIAKGWIADKIGAYLLNSHFSDYLINLGGNILVHGRNAKEKPWTIAIENPISGAADTAYVRSTEASVVTSGTYQRFFTQNGKTLHHILNPKTGYPAESDAVSASIVCEKSLDAEGFSTTALTLGVQDGLAFCKSQQEIEAAFFIDAQGKISSYERQLQ